MGNQNIDISANTQEELILLFRIPANLLVGDFSSRREAEIHRKLFLTKLGVSNLRKELPVPKIGEMEIQ